MYQTKKKEEDSNIAKQQNSPVDLGWENGWKETPPVVIECRRIRLEQGQNGDHKTTDIDVGPPHRGIEHVVRCVKCNYVYRYDSSD